MGDNENLPEGEVSPEGTTSTGGETPPEAEIKEPQAQPLTAEQEARVMQILEQERGRIAQSAKDQAKSEIERAQRRAQQAESRARLAEERAKTYDTSFKSLDEDTQKDIELARLRGETQLYQTLEQQEDARQRQEANRQALKDSLDDELRSYGIDIDDKRIDRADDEADYFKGRSRFTTSVAKILQERQTVAEKALEDRMKELESNLKKELGLESVVTSTSAGVETGDDKFVTGMTDGSLPMTKENVERFNRIREKTK